MAKKRVPIAHKPPTSYFGLLHKAGVKVYQLGPHYEDQEFVLGDKRMKRPKGPHEQYIFATIKRCLGVDMESLLKTVTNE